MLRQVFGCFDWHVFSICFFLPYSKHQVTLDESIRPSSRHFLQEEYRDLDSWSEEASPVSWVSWVVETWNDPRSWSRSLSHGKFMALGYHMLPHEIEWVSENQLFQASFLNCSALRSIPRLSRGESYPFRTLAEARQVIPQWQPVTENQFWMVFLCGVIDTYRNLMELDP